MDIVAWRQSLGLEQYEAVFRDNAVDAEILPGLGEADLEKLGVLLGHRKKLLSSTRPTPPPPMSPASPTGICPSPG